ncbi:MAG: hypothetical protein JXA03_12765 [Bacteroidales bacterium]|nr:hypothetical protein [Bacteroidales bacterium]
MEKVKKHLPAIIIALLFAAPAWAQQGNTGLGILVGEPTGISVKHWLGNTSAVDGALAWSFVNDASLYLHADYLYHHFDLIEVESGKFPVYYGIGGRMKFQDDIRIGAQVPLGISYILESAPLDVFIEIRPVLDLLPATTFTVSGGIGVRYYFQ